MSHLRVSICSSLLWLVDNLLLYTSLFTWFKDRDFLNNTSHDYGKGALFIKPLINQLKLEKMPRVNENTKTLLDECSCSMLHSRIVHEAQQNYINNLFFFPQSNTKSDKRVSVSRTCPGGVGNVEERVVFYHLHGDGFQAYEKFARGTKSYYAASVRLENANSADAYSPLFTRFVCILPEKKTMINDQLGYILKVFCDIGDEGVYYTSKRKCYHFRWAIDNICGDAIAQQDISGQSGKLNSMYHCPFGDCQKWRMDYIMREYIQAFSPSVVGKTPLDCSVPFQFARSKEYFKNISLVANATKNDALETLAEFLESDGVLDPRNDADMKNKLFSDLRDLRAFLDLLDLDSVVFWKKCFTSVKQNVFDRVADIKDALTAARHYCTIGEEEVNDLAFREDPISAALLNLGVTDRATVNLIGTCQRNEGKESVIDFDACFGNDAKHMCISDCMHLVSNLSLRIIMYLNGDIPTPSIAKYMDRIGKHVGLCFGNDLNSINVGKKRLEISPDIVITAMKRCDDLFFTPLHKRVPWVEGVILIPARFQKLTCDQKMIFCFCLFDWIFQDSLKHPFILAVKEIFDLIGYLYNWNRYLQLAVDAQGNLDFFLGMVESIAPPGFASYTCHHTHHLLSSIICGGPLKSNDCFYHEGAIGRIKGLAKGGCNPGMAIADGALLLQRTELPWMLRQFSREDSVFKMRGEEVDLGMYSLYRSHVPWRDVVYANFVDDVEFAMDDTVGHDTFLDMFPTFELGSWNDVEIKEWNRVHQLRALGFSSDESSYNPSNIKVYPRIKWYGVNYCSCSPPTEISQKWLMSNIDALAFTRDAASRIRLYAIIGYVKFTVNGYDYAQAICLPLKTNSQSSFTETQHGVEIMQEVPDAVSIVSLFRLHVGVGIPLRYRTGLLAYKTLTKFCRQTLSIGHVKILETVLKTNKSVSRRGRREKSGGLADLSPDAVQLRMR